MLHLALYMSIALCVTGSPPDQASEDLLELKIQRWNTFRTTLQELNEKINMYNESTSFQDFAKPMAEKHAAGLGRKIQRFKEKHPEVDVAPQSLITLNTEETQALKTESGAIICRLGTPIIHIAARVFCLFIFGWNLQSGDPFVPWACKICLTIPWDAVCLASAISENTIRLR